MGSLPKMTKATRGAIQPEVSEEKTVGPPKIKGGGTQGDLAKPPRASS